ncbi:hypothetical protein MLGJGCBP_00223 [Rhodococcus sp. T7]|nr:hypothetical protein MLGJGCBP_10133 [Rhodococcus sp. T7]KAF0966598.1 hypothetical protein MLGJGCBP_00223 [Rhodococcus sp. T7]
MPPLLSEPMCLTSACINIPTTSGWQRTLGSLPSLSVVMSIWAAQRYLRPRASATRFLPMNSFTQHSSAAPPPSHPAPSACSLMGRL